MRILEMSRSRWINLYHQSFIIGGGLILFLIWSLWTELPEIQDSCADGFVPCPPESYKLLSLSKQHRLQASEMKRKTIGLSVSGFFENTNQEKQKQNTFKSLATDTNQKTTDASQTATDAKLMDRQASRASALETRRIVVMAQKYKVTSAPEHPITAASTDQIGAGKESQTWFLYLPGFFQIVAAVLLALLIFFGIKYLFRKMRCKLPRLRGTYLPLISTQDDIRSDCPVNTATRTRPDLNLSELPLDVEDAVVVELDVPLETRQDKHSNRGTGSAGQCKYGWQKVGHEFGIPKKDLRYLELEYKRESGSPTKVLLKKLGTQGKTVLDLTNALQRPNVNLLDAVSQL